MNVLNSPHVKFNSQELKEMNNFYLQNCKILLSQYFIPAFFIPLRYTVFYISSVVWLTKISYLYSCFCYFVVNPDVVVDFFK